MIDNNVGIYVYIKEEGINAKVYKTVGGGFAVTWSDRTRMDDNGNFIDSNKPVIHNKFVSRDEVEIRGARW